MTSELQVKFDTKTATPQHAAALRSGVDLPFSVETIGNEITVKLLETVDPFDDRAAGRVGSDGQIYWALDALAKTPGRRHVLKSNQNETSEIAGPLMTQVRAWFDAQVKE